MKEQKLSTLLAEEFNLYFGQKLFDGRSAFIRHQVKLVVKGVRDGRLHDVTCKVLSDLNMW